MRLLAPPHLQVPPQHELGGEKGNATHTNGLDRRDQASKSTVHIHASMPRVIESSRSPNLFTNPCTNPGDDVQISDRRADMLGIRINFPAILVGWFQVFSITFLRT
jgi:hypothetical protein